MKVFLSAFLMLAAASLGGAEEKSKPNLVFILADDLGYGDVKCFGGELCQIETPHFDALAAGGMKFTNAHATDSVCVPSRMAIMTGRYAWRFGPPEPGGRWGFLGPRFSPGTFTLGHMLQKAGYRTGYVGKWHLGTRMATTDGKIQGADNVDYTQPLELGPPGYGFDESFILPGSLDMYPYAFVRNNEWVGQVTARKGWSAFNRLGPAAEDFEDHKVLDRFSSEAERFIEQNAGEPFFLYLALTSPHTPVSPRPEFRGKSELGLYGDFVMETDDCVGRVMAALKKNDVVENTLVIATSDHGPASYAGNNPKATFAQYEQMEELGHHSAGIYRGFKFSIYEGGLRVPFVAHWPATVPAGSSCEALLGLQDVVRTFGEITGAEIAPDEAPDSISFLNLLRDPKAKPGRNDLILRSTANYAIRQGKWKLALCPGSGCAGTWGNTPPRNEAWKAAIQAFGEIPTRDELTLPPFIQLFDLETDPEESNDLSASKPERVDAMIRLLRSQIDAGRSTRGPTLSNDRPQIDFLGPIPAGARKL